MKMHFNRILQPLSSLCSHVARAILSCVLFLRAREQSVMVKSPSTSKSAMSQGDGVAPIVGGAMSPLTPASQRLPDGSSSRGNPINAASAFPVGDTRVISVAGDSSIASSETSMSQNREMTPAGGVEGVASRNRGEIGAARPLVRSTVLYVLTNVCHLQELWWVLSAAWPSSAESEIQERAPLPFLIA